MARARNIKPGFFKNEDLAKCSAYARLLYVGLWTLADRDGFLELRPLRIAAEVFPYELAEVNIDSLLGELAEHKFVVPYEANGGKWLWIPKFCEHQSPHKNEKTCQAPEIPRQVCEQYASARIQALYERGKSNDEGGKKNSSSAPTQIRWNPQDGWTGITADDREAWSTAYPACDIDRQLAAMQEWLRSNPEKARKSRWRRFITNWLQRHQNRGGDTRGNRPADRSRLKPTPGQYAHIGREEPPSGEAGPP